MLDAIVSRLRRPCLHYAKTLYLDAAAAEIASWTMQLLFSIVVLIEVCCSRESALGNINNTCGDILIIRVCIEHDFAEKETVDMILSLIKNDNVHVHKDVMCCLSR